MKDLNKYRNDFNRQQYDHFNLMLPKGRKAILQEIAKSKGISLNALINEAIKNSFTTEEN